jgi:hypothetical protein
MVAYKMNLSKKKTYRTQLGLQLSPTNWFWEPNWKTQNAVGTADNIPAQIIFLQYFSLDSEGMSYFLVGFQLPIKGWLPMQGEVGDQGPVE